MKLVALKILNCFSGFYQKSLSNFGFFSNHKNLLVYRQPDLL
jgi:hypothetical protein